MTSRPDLVTTPDKQQRCGVLDKDNNRCPNRAQFWVGANSIDDYTCVCSEHLSTVKMEGDTVVRIREG